MGVGRGKLEKSRRPRTLALRSSTHLRHSKRWRRLTTRNEASAARRVREQSLRLCAREGSRRNRGGRRRWVRSRGWRGRGGEAEAERAPARVEKRAHEPAKLAPCSTQNKESERRGCGSSRGSGGGNCSRLRLRNVQEPKHAVVERAAAWMKGRVWRSCESVRFSLRARVQTCSSLLTCAPQPLWVHKQRAQHCAYLARANAAQEGRSRRWRRRCRRWLLLKGPGRLRKR